MKWVKIQKDPANQPSSGKYNDWKAQLAEEGQHQCVYCAIREISMGGIRNFHVEHYRPKSKPEFSHLINDYCNLFYACPICNTFKSNDWPNDPVNDHSKPSYPDPSNVDYNILFDVDIKQGLVNGNKVASAYMQEKLYLNRPQLVIERRLDFLVRRGDNEVAATIKLLDMISDGDEYKKVNRKFLELFEKFNHLKTKLLELPRYQNEDVQKPT
jgi:uncharacterized protein (TIGR02646 family)